MTELAVGFSREKHTLPERRGQRVAHWVETYIEVQGCSLSEVAFRIRQDKRDLERLLSQRSCGHRLEDALAAYFGWPFVEAVMAPVIDNSIEVEIAKERAEIAAREERLARLYRASQGAFVGPRLVSPEERSVAPRGRDSPGTVGA
jgi:hypothetical protein